MITRQAGRWKEQVERDLWMALWTKRSINVLYIFKKGT